MSRNPPPEPAGAEESLTYLIVDPNADRDRLYVQYELFRADFNTWFDRALQLGDLPTDPASANWRVLDAGCGEGLFAYEIHTRYPAAKIVGFDRDARAISTAGWAFGRQGNPMFYTHDVLERLPIVFEPGVRARRFDVVFASVLLMHVRDPATALRYLAAALKPGGVIFLRDSPTDLVPFPQPGLAPLYAVAMAGLERTALPNFARQHSAYLTAAGFKQVETASSRYAVGGPTADGRRMLQSMVSGLQAARPALVERLQLMSAAEFDAHMGRCSSE